MERQIMATLNNIISEMGAVQKNGTNTFQNFKYQKMEEVINILHPLIAKHKLIITPEVIEIVKEQITTRKGELATNVLVKTKFEFVASDGSNLFCTTYGEANDSSDKATSKAQTDAYKKALLQVLCITTADEKEIESDTIETGKKPVGNSTTIKKEFEVDGVAYLYMKGFSKTSGKPYEAIKNIATTETLFSSHEGFQALKSLMKN